MQTAINYTIFAIIATIVNIGSQDFFLRIYSSLYDIELSILLGTATGLATKYYLDKKYIFKFVTQNKSQDISTFLLYTSMGIVTTLIFWGFELTFEYIFQNKVMRYTGGCLGLAIGYYIKYQLDKRFVFIRQGEET